MTNSISIGIIGDFNPEKPSHIATDAALKHAADFLSLNVKTEWLGTGNLASEIGQRHHRAISGTVCRPGHALFFCRRRNQGNQTGEGDEHPVPGHLRRLSIYTARIRRNVAGIDECRTHRTDPTDGHAFADKNRLRRG